MQKSLLQLPGAQPQDYTEQVGDILALLRGDYRSPEGVEAHVIPGEHATVQAWILGSSGGESAQVAGANGLRFAANYHVSPATVLEAAEGYRAAFRPSAELSAPVVSVSADVVVAGDEASARRLASGYGLGVRSIRSGAGAIPFPAPEEIAAPVHPGTEVDQPGRRPDQRGEQVGRQHVDREDQAQVVGSLHAARLPVADAGIVDDRVEPAQVAHLECDLPHPRDGGQVTGDHLFRAGQRRAGVRRTGAVARVLHDLVPVGGQHLPGHQAEAVRRSGDENPSRRSAPFLRFRSHTSPARSAAHPGRRAAAARAGAGR